MPALGIPWRGRPANPLKLNEMKKIGYYIRTLRPRTLPLSVSGILVGSGIARAQCAFSWPVFILALLTTLLLQILCNIANELGDGLKGTDNENRLGPALALQEGVFTPATYYRLIAFFALASVASGILLVYEAFGSLWSQEALSLLCAGAVALAAALTYTLGRKPYGYRGWGDLSVFLFFGLLSTCGAYFLLCPDFSGLLSCLLPASSAGLFITGVLNVNNMRDIENDALFGKRTLAVKIGLKRAKRYHFFLISGGWACMLAHTLLTFSSPWNFLYAACLPLSIAHLRCIAAGQGRELDPQLKQLSLSTLLFCFLAAAGMVAGASC